MADKLGNINKESWWGRFTMSSYSVSLKCFSLYIRPFFWLHWHKGKDKDMPNNYSNFRIRSFELFGCEIPFIKYYEV